MELAIIPLMFLGSLAGKESTDASRRNISLRSIFVLIVLACIKLLFF